MSFTGYENDNSFVMNQLSNMSPEEFVETAEHLMDDRNADFDYRKIFSTMNENNEFSRS